MDINITKLSDKEIAGICVKYNIIQPNELRNYTRENVIQEKLNDLNAVYKKKAYDCSGIYMANYFLPSGEEFEYSMKEKSMASVKVLKTYALEIGIKEGTKKLLRSPQVHLLIMS